MTLEGHITANELEDEEHWLEQVRGFVDNILQEAAERQEQLSQLSLELTPVNPLQRKVSSVWVDGGSTFLDVNGGSVYLVRAAAGYFRPNQPVVWYVLTSSGFTTLPRQVDRFVSIQRDILEIECAMELLGHNPDFVVLDNSLASYATQGVPHSILEYFTFPTADDSPEHEYFDAFVRFMRRFDVLIQQCQIRDIPLIGAAKDPRSRIFARSLGLTSGMNDSSAIAMLAGSRTGFTNVLEAKYLEIPRVKQYFEQQSILTEGRGEFLTTFGILKPNARIFRLDFLRSQQDMRETIQRFIVSMHDGNGYVLPSHVVHNKATIPDKLSDSLLHLIMSKIAKENMSVARAVFGSQRRSRFGRS